MQQTSSGIQPTITIQCAQPRIYNITTREGVTYRKTQTHFEALPTTKQKNQKMNILVICGH